MARLKIDEIRGGLKSVDTSEAERIIEKEGEKYKIIVLDDDPTGIQTVHDVYVYTGWSAGSIRAAFSDGKRISYILTNSRSFTADETERVHKQIALNILKAADEQNREFIVISRGDSTLRGHYPLETDTIRKTLELHSGKKMDGEVIMPFFMEGGRFTIGNVHYVEDGGLLKPAGETEFAADKTFGYHASNLGEWVEEKTRGVFRKEDLVYISLEDLRESGIETVTEKLLSVNNFNKVIVNAVDYCDVKIFGAAVYMAMSKGKRFLFRTAAALPKIMGAVSDRPLLSRNELVSENSKNGGLIVVGSHVRKTTEQLNQLHELSGISFVEFNQHLVLDSSAFETEINRVISLTDSLISSGKTAAVFTRRDRLDLNTGSKEDELKISVKISDAITRIVASLNAKPSFLIAKGGITSSDIGVKALRVKVALVAGQIKPGVPVWLTGKESKFPGLPYIIFPGNVGGRDTLKEAVEMLMCAE